MFLAVLFPLGVHTGALKLVQLVGIPEGPQLNNQCETLRQKVRGAGRDHRIHTRWNQTRGAHRQVQQGSGTHADRTDGCRTIIDYGHELQ
jgi:hypothetical protein